MGTICYLTDLLGLQLTGFLTISTSGSHQAGESFEDQLGPILLHIALSQFITNQLHIYDDSSELQWKKK